MKTEQKEDRKDLQEAKRILHEIKTGKQKLLSWKELQKQTKTRN